MNKKGAVRVLPASPPGWIAAARLAPVMKKPVASTVQVKTGIPYTPTDRLGLPSRWALEFPVSYEYAVVFGLDYALS